MGWMQATTSISLGGEGEDFSLTSPLIGLIEKFSNLLKGTPSGIAGESPPIQK
jgi:hypothetical protein